MRSDAVGLFLMGILSFMGSMLLLAVAACIAYWALGFTFDHDITVVIVATAVTTSLLVPRCRCK